MAINFFSLCFSVSFHLVCWNSFCTLLLCHSIVLCSTTHIVWWQGFSVSPLSPSSHPHHPHPHHSHPPPPHHQKKSIVIIYHDHRFINLSLIIVFLELFPGTSLDFTLFADHGIVNPHEQVFQRPFGRRQTSSRPEQDALSSWFWVHCVYTCSNDSPKHIKGHQIICKQSSANPQTESNI